MSDAYEKLSEPFVTFTDTRGGATFSYITGEQCATRLNTVLQPWNWSFKVKEHGIHHEADECWSLGELTATFVVDGERHTVTREQFGSQKIKRSRATGTPLDIGFDLKGAATDAMKKCATLIGVGLYLSEKDNPREDKESEYSDVAQQAIALGHPHADKLRTTKPSDLKDAVLESSTQKLRAWIAANQPPAA